MSESIVDSRVGQRIVGMRYVRGMTQKDLADKAGRWPSTIMRIEKGLSMPPPVTLHAIAHALSCDVTDLLGPDQKEVA